MRPEVPATEVKVMALVAASQLDCEFATRKLVGHRAVLSDAALLDERGVRTLQFDTLDDRRPR